MRPRRLALPLLAAVCAVASGSLFVSSGVEATFADQNRITVSVHAGYWAPAQCAGMTYSMKFLGTDADDVYAGGNRSQLILGLPGDDELSGGNSDDCIDGGTGNNRLFGNNGSDVIVAGDGNNYVDTGNANDEVVLGDGDNTVVTGNGTDSTTLGNGSNTFAGGTGNDVVHVGTGYNNRIDGGKGISCGYFGWTPNSNDTVGILQDWHSANLDVIRHLAPIEN